MNDILLLLTVSKREAADEFIKFLKTNGAPVIYTCVGRGTARRKTLDLLGLEKTEKAVHISVTDGGTAKVILHKFTSEMQIDLPDRGVCVAVPVSSIGGRRTMDYYLNGKKADERDEASMYEHELIIAICDSGYSEAVMDAAKKAGAAGGTVVHAKGTAAQRAEKFFGVSLADEKEMIFIVTTQEKRNGIMKAIMHDAGIDTKAKALVFSLPVSETAGLRLIEND